MYTQDAMKVFASSHYLHWGVVQISLANLIVIVAMVVIFVLALVLPFPHGRSEENAAGEPDVER
jgi:hypothetical protein